MRNVQAIAEPEVELLVENRPMDAADEALVSDYIRRFKARQQEQRGLDSVLHEIFSMPNLPAKLEKARLDWLNGKLQQTTAIQIVQEYSDYQVQVFCVPKN